MDELAPTLVKLGPLGIAALSFLLLTLVVYKLIDKRRPPARHEDDDDSMLRLEPPRRASVIPQHLRIYIDDRAEHKARNVLQAWELAAAPQKRADLERFVKLEGRVEQVKEAHDDMKGDLATFRSEVTERLDGFSEGLNEIAVRLTGRSLSKRSSEST